MVALNLRQKVGNSKGRSAFSITTVAKAAAIAQENDASVPMITYSLTSFSFAMLPKRSTDLAAIRNPMLEA